MFGDGLSQAARSPGYGVLIDVVLDRATGGVFQNLRSREIGHPLRQVHRVILQRLDRHAPDHAFRESRSFLRDERELHQHSTHD